MGNCLRGREHVIWGRRVPSTQLWSLRTCCERTKGQNGTPRQGTNEHQGSGSERRVGVRVLCWKARATSSLGSCTSVKSPTLCAYYFWEIMQSIICLQTTTDRSWARLHYLPLLMMGIGAFLHSPQQISHTYVLLLRSCCLNKWPPLPWMVPPICSFSMLSHEA